MLVISSKTSRVKFFFSESASWTIDGEYGSSHHHAVIENIPKALHIIVPKVPQAISGRNSLKAAKNPGNENLTETVPSRQV